MQTRSSTSSQNAPALAEGILEIVTIPAFEELPWLFEMKRGRKLSISLIANQAVDVVICAEDDYDTWVESGMETDRPEFGYLESNRASQHCLQLRSPVAGLLVVLVVNPNGTEAEIAISLVEG